MVTELQSLRTAIVSITNTIHHLNKEYDQLEQQKDDIEEEMDQLAKQIDSLEKHKIMLINQLSLNVCNHLDDGVSQFMIALRKLYPIIGSNQQYLKICNVFCVSDDSIVATDNAVIAEIKCDSIPATFRNTYINHEAALGTDDEILRHICAKETIEVGNMCASYLTEIMREKISQANLSADFNYLDEAFEKGDNGDYTVLRLKSHIPETFGVSKVNIMKALFRGKTTILFNNVPRFGIGLKNDEITAFMMPIYTIQ